MLNEILGQAARYNQLLTRKFGLTGGAPSPQLTPEISPTYEIEGGPEGRILQNEILMSAVIVVAAVAVKLSVAQLRNPVGSGVALVLERIGANNLATAAFVRAGVGALTTDLPSLPAAGGISRRDTRSKAAGGYNIQASGIVSADNSPATVLSGNLFERKLPVDGGFEYSEPVVISPGYGVQVVQETVNLTLVAEFSWREVPLASGEFGPF